MFHCLKHILPWTAYLKERVKLSDPLIEGLHKYLQAFPEVVQIPRLAGSTVHCHMILPAVMRNLNRPPQLFALDFVAFFFSFFAGDEVCVTRSPTPRERGNRATNAQASEALSVRSDAREDSQSRGASGQDPRESGQNPPGQSRARQGAPHV